MWLVNRPWRDLLMANPNMPKGAEPCGELYPPQIYVAGATIYPGDLLMKNSSGQVVPATASQALVGVSLEYAVAGAELRVLDHPDQEFVIQADGAVPGVQADIGYNYDITPGAPNATYKRSSMQLASASKAATATLPLRVIRIARDYGNALGANVKCVVRINNHQNASGTGVAGV